MNSVVFGGAYTIVHDDPHIPNHDVVISVDVILVRYMVIRTRVEYAVGSCDLGIPAGSHEKSVARDVNRASNEVRPRRDVYFGATQRLRSVQSGLNGR